MLLAEYQVYLGRSLPAEVFLCLNDASCCVKAGIMIRTTINLPTKHRLHLHLVRKRGASNESTLLPRLEHVRRARKGSKFSRYFRHLFEHKNIKRVFGANLALIITATTFLPGQTSALANQTEEVTVAEENVVLTTEKRVQFPTEDIEITQGYRFYHPAIDLNGVTGDAIYPIKPGKVEAIDHSRFAYGNAVLLDHGHGQTSLYAHLSTIEVETGQEVDMKTKIGEMGATGRAFGDHLHLEIRDHGRAVNPMSVLPPLN